MVTPGTNVTVTYNDTNGTLTIDASGGGAGTITPLTFGRAATTATQTLPSGTWTPVSFPKITDTAGGAMTSTRFTAAQAGIYGNTTGEFATFSVVRLGS